MVSLVISERHVGNAAPSDDENFLIALSLALYVQLPARVFDSLLIALDVYTAILLYNLVLG